MLALAGCGDDDGGMDMMDAGDGMMDAGDEHGDDGGGGHDDDGGHGDDDAGSGGDGGVGELTMELSVENLAPVGPDLQYEGWIIVNEEPVSTGTFSIDENGDPDPSTFPIDGDQAAQASKAVISIEPDPDNDPAPSATKVLAGPINIGTTEATADLVVSDGAALDTDFSGAQGAYVLNTPTTSETEDYNQGIWWLMPGDSPSPNLTLPTLPDGWVYEGWVVDTSDGMTPVTTGQFPAATENPGHEADADGAGPDSGSGSAPPYPGQDFIMDSDVSPRDLTTDHMAVISVEPNMDGDPAAPYSIKPLVDMTIDDETPPTTQDMTDGPAPMPMATATVDLTSAAN
jgi:hypothetical protein